jgi:3-phenylpropionate/cinnamic acid dioxygenase small subunit
VRAIEGELHDTSREFLFREAELLDNRQWREWLALLTEDIDYRVPNRITAERAHPAAAFSDQSFHMLETFASLSARVARLESEYAWSDNPPSRTRRFVSNIRAQRAESGDELSVKSNLLLVRGLRDGPPELIYGERHDVLRWTEDGLRLARRLVLLDHTVIPTHHLAFFL